VRGRLPRTLDRSGVIDPLSAANGSWFPVAVKIIIEGIGDRGQIHAFLYKYWAGFYFARDELSRFEYEGFRGAQGRQIEEERQAKDEK
jgi:hypothetical protein